MVSVSLVIVSLTDTFFKEFVKKLDNLCTKSQFLCAFVKKLKPTPQRYASICSLVRAGENIFPFDNLLLKPSLHYLSYKNMT